MPVMRGPDGKIIESGSGDTGDEETRRVRRRSVNTDETAASTGDTSHGGGSASDDERTEPIGSRGGSTSRGSHASDEGSDEPRTRILRRGSASEDEGAAGGDSMDDPVVGWVVVVDGPGRGTSLPLGYGMNSIGRSKGERICLDFGDEQISRSRHAVITYDPRGRKYFVQHGGGRNLTYLGGDQPVLTPVELKGGEEIVLGETKLRFVPFCGESFDWQDQPDR